MKAAALAGLLVSACLSKPPQAPSEPSKPITVRVWGDEGVGGNKAVMDGCRLWGGAIECIPVEHWRDAEVTFHSLLIPGTIVGLAFPNGVVLIDTELRRSYLSECIAHELGHEVGIDHVPLYGPVQQGRPMGRAVMNPVLSYHFRVTEADLLGLKLARRKLYD